MFSSVREALIWVGKNFASNILRVEVKTLNDDEETLNLYLKCPDSLFRLLHSEIEIKK